MLEGIILKGYSGFYYVKYEDKIYECSLRGKNRIKKVKFLPGDKVLFEPLNAEKAVIEEVLPRRNELLRPPIANVKQVIIVSSLQMPEPDLWLIDRLLILSQWNNIEPIICFNKADLTPTEKIEELQRVYEPTGFQVIFCSTKSGQGIDKLKKLLEDKVSVFAGSSGVGKSSILNSLEPGLKLQTGEISDRLKRGKHTTRHVELLPLSPRGLVADTPGFSSLNLPPDIIREELSGLFPDFLPFREGCKFSTCLHKNEPLCGVKTAVEKGVLADSRYSNYLTFLEEVIKQERSF